MSPPQGLCHHDRLGSGHKPFLAERGKGNAEIALLWFFIVGPMLAVAGAVPFAWGWGLSWLDIAIGAVFYTLAGLGVTGGFHRLFTHRSYKARRWLEITFATAACLSLEMSPIAPRARYQFASARLSLARDVADRVGRRASPAPPVQRPDRRVQRDARPPLAVAVRHYQASTGEGVPPFAHGLAVQARTHQPGSFRQGHGQRPCHAMAGEALRLPRGGHVYCSGHPRWADLLELARCPHRLLLGGAGTRGAVAPRHVLGQLDLPHDRQPAVRVRRQGRQLLAAGHPQLRRIVAQLSPRRPKLRAPWRHEGPDRHHRPPDLDLREAGLGLGCPLAGHGEVQEEAGGGLTRLP